MSKEEFYAGAMTENPDAEPKQVEEWWNMVNQDKNDYISKDEFFKMKLLEDSDDDDTDSDDSDDDKDDTREVWNKYVKDTSVGMTFDELKEGWKDYNATTSEKEIKQAWDFVNLDGSDTLSYKEFFRLMKLGEGPPKEIWAKLKWYWQLFAGKRGMSWEQYVKGSKIESPDTPMDELKKYFKKLDRSGNGRLSKREFMAMGHMDGK